MPAGASLVLSVAGFPTQEQKDKFQLFRKNSPFLNLILGPATTAPKRSSNGLLGLLVAPSSCREDGSKAQVGLLAPSNLWACLCQTVHCLGWPFWDGYLPAGAESCLHGFVVVRGRAPCQEWAVQAELDLRAQHVPAVSHAGQYHGELSLATFHQKQNETALLLRVCILTTSTTAPALL